MVYGGTLGLHGGRRVCMAWVFVAALFSGAARREQWCETEVQGPAGQETRRLRYHRHILSGQLYGAQRRSR